jgi:hypothetical protein
MEAGRVPPTVVARSSSSPTGPATGAGAEPATPSDDSDRAARWRFGWSRSRRPESWNGNGAAWRAKKPGQLADIERKSIASRRTTK